MTTNNKEDQLIHDCYHELYKRATPSVDFDVLRKNATLNEIGQKEIPFNDYVIDDALLREIIDKYAKQLKPKWKALRFKNTIMLGCSPKSLQ